MRSSRLLVGRESAGLLLLPVLLSSSALAADANRVTKDLAMKDIRATWDALYAHVQSVHFVWHETRRYTPGSIFPPVFAEMHDIGGRATELGIPVRDIELIVPILLRPERFSHTLELKRLLILQTAAKTLTPAP